MAKTSKASAEDFAALLAEYPDLEEGSVVKGSIIKVTSDEAIVEVGSKSEGRISLREFSKAEREGGLKEGDIVDVYVERIDSRDGMTMLSREKARREEAWVRLEKEFKANNQVEGTIFGKVKGGFTVDLDGAVAFLPSSQLDVRPVRDTNVLFGEPQPYLILKMDRRRGNIVVSRRAILEEGQDANRAEIIDNLAEGQVLNGIVKNITDYGAFIDLGGIDGLVHVTDISWKRVNHPSEVLKVGQKIDVKIIKFDAESKRVSLGIKQLEENPWSEVISKFSVNSKHKGKVTSLTDYGAFVELEGGVEGLVHVSELSWTKKNVHPSKVLNAGDEVEVMILEIDTDKRRMSLGIKQCQDNPWNGFEKDHKVGDTLKGKINNITEFGLFVGMTAELDGMVHINDLSWEKPGDEVIKDYKKGDEVEVKILDIDAKAERVALGIKQLTAAPEGYDDTPIKKGDVITVTVAKTDDKGVEVRLSNGQVGFIKRSDLARDKGDQRPDRFAVDERVDAKVLSAPKGKPVSLSIKAMEIEEERKAMAEYGSSDSGASLGDILGAALQEKQGKKEKK